MSAPTPFAGIIFDCDGVLIDASESYDLAVERSAAAFASILGVKFESEQLRSALAALRKLGTFNNDWDSLSVIVSYLFAHSPSREAMASLAKLTPLSSRLRALEAQAITATAEVRGSQIVNLGDLVALLEGAGIGTKMADLISRLIPDAGLRRSFYGCISYPGPVGESLLATFFDEVMYGAQVFKSTYGLECSTSAISSSGLIKNEKLLVTSATLEALSKLCGGNLGIITGRPKVPTIHTLRDLYTTFFPNTSLCLFTGDYLLNAEEVKPSPKPMLRVASALANQESNSGGLPILYVGDSGEDMLMVKRTNNNCNARNTVMFAAIAREPNLVDFFKNSNNIGDDTSLDCIVPSINDLPEALLGERLIESENRKSDAVRPSLARLGQIPSKN